MRQIYLSNSGVLRIACTNSWNPPAPENWMSIGSPIHEYSVFAERLCAYFFEGFIFFEEFMCVYLLGDHVRYMVYNMRKRKSGRYLFSIQPNITHLPWHHMAEWPNVSPGFPSAAAQASGVASRRHLRSGSVCRPCWAAPARKPKPATP